MYLKTIKATIKLIIVALLITILSLLIIYSIFKNEINEAISYIELISKNEKNTIINSEEKIKFQENKIIEYPEYGSKYANIIIEKININLPVFFGDDLNILKKGVGHSSGSYFPGEGGTIIYMGHNYEKIFRDFDKLEKEDKIILDTEYGKFEYEIYDYKIINEKDLNELPIQKEKEILMIYTCYPLNNIGYAYQRYVIYANLINRY